MLQSNKAHRPELLNLCSATRSHCNEKPAHCDEEQPSPATARESLYSHEDPAQPQINTAYTWGVFSLKSFTGETAMHGSTAGIC